MKQDGTDREKSSGAPVAPLLPLLSLRPLLYYENMDLGILIPIAFLSAGPVAVILSMPIVG
jgi:hypothetical protein